MTEKYSSYDVYGYVISCAIGYLLVSVLYTPIIRRILFFLTITAVIAAYTCYIGVCMFLKFIEQKSKNIYRICCFILSLLIYIGSYKSLTENMWNLKYGICWIVHIVSDISFGIHLFSDLFMHIPNLLLRNSIYNYGIGFVISGGLALIFDLLLGASTILIVTLKY